MIARVQYNDFTGTAAADISDFYANSMDEYIHALSGKYDMNRYHCIGCEFYLAGKDSIGVVFYCRDRENNKVVPMSFNNREFKFKDLYIMFKRLSVVIGERIQEEAQPDEGTIYLD